MKAEELKIGDWVSYRGRGKYRIAELELETCSYWAEDDDLCVEMCYEPLTPIPLTKEILEKNGWKLRTKNVNCVNIYCNGNLRMDEVITTGKIHFVSDNINIELNYVHQLQHILWALGIDDDLKI